MSRDHACPYPGCDGTFVSALELEMHLLAVHQCRICGMLLTDDRERTGHEAAKHGVEFEYDGLEIELPKPRTIPGWQPPHIGAPNNASELYVWISPLCALIATATTPEAALREAPPELGDRVEYVKSHFERVRRTLRLVRYKRLKNSASKTKCLMIVLAHPEYAPATALDKIRASSVPSSLACSGSIQRGKTRPHSGQPESCEND